MIFPRLLAFLFVFSIVPPAGAAEIPFISGMIHRAQIVKALESGGNADLARKDDLEAFYKERNYKPVWLGTDPGRAAKVERLLQTSWSHGLHPAAYHVTEISRLLKDPDADPARLELLLTDGAAEYGRDITGFRLDPASVRQNAQYWRHPTAPGKIMRALADSGDPAAYLDGLAPRDPLYVRLRRELIRMVSAMSEDRKAERIDLGGAVARPGGQNPGIPELRRRLGVAYDPSAGAETVYDRRLAAAVKSFQKKNGLKADGTVGPSTLDVLNASPDRDRAARIVTNMERLRWLDGEKPSRYVLVNIPSQMLWAIDGGKVAAQMSVVVGKVDRPTRSFRTDITGIRFNPKWTVPQSIKMKDFLPILREDPAILAEKGIDLYAIRDGRRVPLDPAAIDWASVTAAEMGKMRMVQGPGDHNSLGRIRVLMPNEYDIYLHDTNHRELFAQDDRFFSSGCIRLSDPETMARFVLRDKAGWSDQSMEAALQRGTQRDVAIGAVIPIYILYQTIWQNRDGGLVFGPDIYGVDRQMAEAMAKARAYWLPGMK